MRALPIIWKRTRTLVCLQLVPPDWIFGGFESVVAAVSRMAPAAAAAAAQLPLTINTVWGCGSWGMTQVLAEIARGGWGIVTAEEFIAQRPDPALPMDWRLDFEWTRMVQLAMLAPQTEYSRRR